MQEVEVREVIEARLTTLLALSGAIFLGGCLGGGGGGGDPVVDAGAQPPASASCGATLDDAGEVFFPRVTADDGSYAYTLTPVVPKLSPMQYTVTRQAPAADAAACPAVAYSANKGELLVAAHVAGDGRSVTLSFKPLAGTANFQKVTGTGVGAITGFVGGSVPVANATVTVRDVAGNVVGTTQTNENGAFVMFAPSLPDSLKVVASGGTQAGAPLSGSLKAEMENFTSTQSAVSLRLTPVTTLVAAYRERNPIVSLDGAMGKVRIGLDIAGDMAIDADDQASSDYVDDAAFYAAARAVGSIDTLVEQVLADWAYGTVRKFAPATVTGSDEPTVLTKMILSSVVAGGVQRPMAASLDTAPTAGFLPPEVDTLVSIAGVAYSIYAGSQTATWQQNVVESLKRIENEVNQVSKKIDTLTSLALDGNYLLKVILLKELDRKLTKAFQSLVWLGTTTRRFQGSCASLSANIKMDDAEFTSIRADCVPWATDWVLVRDNKANIKEVSSVNLTKLDEPWELFKNSVTTPGGLLSLFQQKNINHIRPENISQKQFYTWVQSRNLWDHHRYWQAQMALQFFFQAGILKNLNIVETDRAKYIEQVYAEVVKRINESKAFVPERQLPRGMFIDPYNSPWNSTTQGTPLVWWPYKPAAVTACWETVTYTPDWVGNNKPLEQSTQAALKREIACYETRPENDGLRGWRLPTITEWEAFSLTSGRPGSEPVGDWLSRRGLVGDPNVDAFSGDWFRDRWFYALEGLTCPAYWRNYADVVKCSDFTLFLRFTVQGSTLSGDEKVRWTPSFWFSRNHTPTSGATVAYVMPVRPTKKGEFY